MSIAPAVIRESVEALARRLTDRDAPIDERVRLLDALTTACSNPEDTLRIEDLVAEFGESVRFVAMILVADYEERGLAEQLCAREDLVYAVCQVLAPALRDCLEPDQPARVADGASRLECTPLGGQLGCQPGVPESAKAFFWDRFFERQGAKFAATRIEATTRAAPPAATPSPNRNPALTSCKACGGDVSREARTCPACGQPHPQPGCLAMLLVGGLLFVGAIPYLL